jgi:hypothetical protein
MQAMLATLARLVNPARPVRSARLVNLARPAWLVKLASPARLVKLVNVASRRKNLAVVRLGVTRRRGGGALAAAGGATVQWVKAGKSAHAGRVIITLVFAALVAAAPSITAGAVAGDRLTLQTLLAEFLRCASAATDRGPCDSFVGRALKRVYGIRDFEQPAGSDRFLSAERIAALVAASPDWVTLGNAADQDALDEARAYAGDGYAVLAVKSGHPGGHVALVLPGPLTASGSWKLNVPRSASFFLDRAQGSYVGKPLSFAFSSAAGVKLYGHDAGR